MMRGISEQPVQGKCLRCNERTWVWRDGYCSARCRWLDGKGNTAGGQMGKCEVCGERLRKPSRGPMPQVCGPRCRQTKYRRRKAHMENRRRQAARDAVVDMGRVRVDFKRRARMVGRDNGVIGEETMMFRDQTREVMRDMLDELARLDPDAISQADREGFVMRLCRQIDRHGASGDAARILKSARWDGPIPDGLWDKGE